MCKLFRNLFGGRNKPAPTPVDPGPSDPVEPAPVDPVDPAPVDPVEPAPVEPVNPTPVTPPPVTPPTSAYGLFQDPKYALKSTDIADVTLEAGQPYTIQSMDIDATGSPDFERIAERFGMHTSSLVRFNPGGSFAEGDQLYVPSVDELLFMDCYENEKTIEQAITAFEQIPANPNRQLLQAARYRGSGSVGVSYGTRSLEFFSPNTDLVGASESRRMTVNNLTEYRVNWGPDLWKCNIFAHDCVYFCGYQPDVKPNAHYITAGSLHQSSLFEKLTIDNMTPGCMIQLFNGSDSNASHNMILISFIAREKVEGEADTEKWTFKAMGAESDRAAVSIRTHFVKTNTSGDYYEVDAHLDYTGRRFVRFFRPKFKRDTFAAV